MSLRQSRTEYVSIIPADLRLFEPADIPKVFEYLQKEFHLHSSWAREYRMELQKIQRGMPEQEFFFRFCRDHFDPALQKLLRRRESVIFALARYIIRDRIRDRKYEQANHRNYHQKADVRKK
ncbi:MAG TPA: hypothetical protein VEB86_19505 [Chryseosolibacter sp.]|nr:hypothetical protein [Chryseosolibacter sp.]